MEVIDGIKVFHDYKTFFSWVNNYNNELTITIGGDVFCYGNNIARFNFIKKQWE